MEKVPFSDPLLFFSIIGMHPLEKTRFAQTRKWFFLVVIALTITTCLMELFLNFEGLETFTRASEIMFPQYQLVWKVFAILSNRQNLARLIKDSTYFWPLDHFDAKIGQKLERTHTKLRRFYFWYKVFMGGSCLQYVTAPIVLQTFTIRGMMVCYNENLDLPMSVRIAYFILHALYMFCNLCVVCGFDGLFFYLVGHILSELDMVRIGFGGETILPSWDDHERFRLSAIHHSFIMRFIKLTSNTYSIALLNQYISGFFALCFGLFLISKDGLPPATDTLAKFSSYLFVFVWQMWTFCFAGNLIIESSSQIPNNVFHETWNVDPKLRDSTGRMLAILRGHQPAKLTIGGFMDLDLESFSQIINQSFSFFTFLSAMYTDDQ